MCMFQKISFFSYRKKNWGKIALQGGVVPQGVTAGGGSPPGGTAGGCRARKKKVPEKISKKKLALIGL